MTAALEGGEWSVARPGRTLPPGKTQYPFYGRLGGPQGRSGRAENLVPTGIRSRTVQPVVRRYIDWTTRPTHTHTHTHTHTCVCKYIYMYTGWAKSRYTLIAYYYIMHTNFWPTLYIGLLSYDALLRSKLFLCPWHEIILINHFPLLAVIVEDDW